MLSPQASLNLRLDLYGVDAEIVAAGRRFWHALRPEFNDITLRFYDRLRANPETARFLPGERGIERLRAAQSVHWEDLFAGHFDTAYVRRVQHTAEAHMRARLPNTHYMAAYEFFLNELVARAERLFQDPEDRRPIVAAIHKLVMIDMDLTMSFYMQRLVRAGAADHAADHEHAHENA